MTADEANALRGGSWCGDEIHPYHDYDPEKAGRLTERLEEIGGVARVSMDLYHMLVPSFRESATALGFSIACDPKLPPNGVVRA